MAQNFLYSVRHDNRYTDEEARLLDLCLVLHAEHGGGNNSAFACRVLSSSGTDIYSSIAAAVGSLKGPATAAPTRRSWRCSGHIEAEVSDWTDDDAVRDYLGACCGRRRGDRSGLIYGMGHAIYTLSDPGPSSSSGLPAAWPRPRACWTSLSALSGVERSPRGAGAPSRGEEKVVCANVDLFSGLVYKMMGIPMSLTPPCSPWPGWWAGAPTASEEVCQPANRIIRPAYKRWPPCAPLCRWTRGEP